jgi:type VI secretion system protein ImpK
MHNPNDPFGGSDDDERTIMRPNPGRRAAGQQPRAPEPPASPGPVIDVTELSGLNPLEKAASLLLNLLGQIRNTSSHPNPSGLHQQLTGEVKQFETRAQKSDIPPETIFTARYVLCTTVDEFVLSTPWGANSIWRQQSLLRIYHQETSGGEKFFLLLDKLIHDPAKNIDLLELMYVCLALGFQGRYRVETDGANTLEAIRENLYRTIRNHRGDNETALSLNWEGIDKSLQSKKVRMPMWAILAIVFAVLGFVYATFSFQLKSHTEPLYVLSDRGKEENLLPVRTLAAAPIVRIAPPPAPERFSLKKFLGPEIDRGLVTVDEGPEKTIVLIKGDGLFDSGVDVVKSNFMPILGRISQGLKQTRGRIEVTGHTDNVPIATRRFPSNRSLSQARAEEVVRILSGQVTDVKRMSAVGMADTKPIASNETTEGKRKNRRVEITVFERARGA